MAAEITIDSNTLVAEFWSPTSLLNSTPVLRMTWTTASYTPQLGDRVTVDGTTYLIGTVTWSIRDSTKLLARIDMTALP